MILQTAHLLLAAVWTGSMAYSLNVVQPKVARFFPDEQEREDFLVLLAHGNRWKVVGMIAALLTTAAAVLATGPSRPVAIGFGVAITLETFAAVVFVDVSWRHWPARVFAVRTELAGFRRALKIRAWTILTLVGSAFTIALAVSVGWHR
jgi:hypothetical protein